MSDSNRRQFLKRTLAALVQVAGSVTVASAAVGSTRTQDKKKPEEKEPPTEDLQQRADELAATHPAAEAEAETAAQFLNWRPGGGIGWRNGGWNNGVWRNGGWSNFPWNNGIWRNGGWSSFPWMNGGWGNGGGWRNWW